LRNFAVGGHKMSPKSRTTLILDRYKQCAPRWTNFQFFLGRLIGQKPGTRATFYANFSGRQEQWQFQELHHRMSRVSQSTKELVTRATVSNIPVDRSSSVASGFSLGACLRAQ